MLIFYQFQSRCLCSYLFFNLKIFQICSYLFTNFSLFLSAVICFLVSKCSKFVLIPLAGSALCYVELFVFWVQKTNVFWALFLLAVICFLASDCSISFLFFHQFQPRSLCGCLFFNLKMFKICFYYFIRFNIVLCAVICLSVSKYSKFVLSFSPHSVWFFVQLFVFRLKRS